MAREFSMTFDYKTKKFKARVVISGADPDRMFTVDIPDPALRDLLPEGKLIFNAEKKVENGEGEASADPALVETILEELEKHERDTPPGGMW
jgi:hypothetical protein